MAKIPYKGRNVTYRLYSGNEIGKSENYSEIYIPPNILPNVSNIKKFLVNNTYNISWDYTTDGLNDDDMNFTGFWCPGKPLTIDECNVSISASTPSILKSKLLFLFYYDRLFLFKNNLF